MRRQRTETVRAAGRFGRHRLGYADRNSFLDAAGRSAAPVELHATVHDSPGRSGAEHAGKEAGKKKMMTVRWFGTSGPLGRWLATTRIDGKLGRPRHYPCISYDCDCWRYSEPFWASGFASGSLDGRSSGWQWRCAGSLRVWRPMLLSRASPDGFTLRCAGFDRSRPFTRRRGRAQRLAIRLLTMRRRPRRRVGGVSAPRERRDASPQVCSRGAALCAGCSQPPPAM